VRARPFFPEQARPATGEHSLRTVRAATERHASRTLAEVGGDLHSPRQPPVEIAR